MASKEDGNLTQLGAVLLYDEVRDAVLADPSPAEARLAADQSRLIQGAKDFMAVYEEKRDVVLGIDLNVSLAADENVEFLETKHGGMQVHCESWREAAENVCENGVEVHCSEIMEIGSAREEDLRYNNRQWEALLEAAEMASADYEECPRKRERKIIRTGQHNQNKDGRNTAAVEVAPPVLRLRRERAAALPQKYRDSVLDYTVEAAIIATKRKFSG